MKFHIHEFLVRNYCLDQSTTTSAHGSPLKKKKKSPFVPFPNCHSVNSSLSNISKLLSFKEVKIERSNEIKGGILGGSRSARSSCYNFSLLTDYAVCLYELSFNCLLIRRINMLLVTYELATPIDK